MHPWQMHLGYVVGGARLIGTALARSIRRGETRFSALLLCALFGGLGVVVGIYAETFDHHTFVNNIVILPLTFVGGVFYSVDVLPTPWEEISHLNPIFYMVNAVRYGFLGESDVAIGLCLGVTAAFALACLAWSQWLFTTGAG